jgi:hypothetical protein
MSHRINFLSRRPALVLLQLMCAATMLTACGGGGSAGPTSLDSKTSFAAGPITGFGSIIVNGVRFDDSSASVSDDDGNARSRDDLRLGMMTEVTGAGISSDDSGSHSRANSVRFGSEIVGPVQSVAADGKSLVVLGQQVLISTTTMFDDRMVGGLAGLVAGTSVVEVHGVLDVAAGTYTATRIEPKSNPLFYKLRGTVSGIDKTARTFKVGQSNETISYSGIAAAVSSSLDNGQLVRVKLQTAPVAGQWVATSVQTGVRRMDDHDETEVKGTITSTSFALDKKFSVNGMPVDATNATFPKGTAGIVLGARVEVKGSTVNGVIVATRVNLESDDDRQSEGFELHGAISALDTGAKTFLLRGVTVSYAGSGIEYRKGTEANLANARRVEVKGVRSSDGTKLAATRISFED